MAEDIFGPLIGTWNVEQATIATLREWMPTYLAEVERQNGLTNKALGRPISPQGYYGGLDFQSELPGKPPAVIVTVEPEGNPEATAMGYTQAYRISVGCIVYGSTEEEARMHASLYGVATMLLAQKGSLGGLAEDLIMGGAPSLEWVDPEASERRLIRSVATFTGYVSDIVRRGVGPAGETLATSEPELKAAEPEVPPGSRPNVTSTHLTVT